ncbi:hypothetical protein TWF102_005670 [Orbilia oligospora]|uniref:Uncharacterized protein n=1 Tax=Orbilia oligospora TaxID=2813651 RepID=A0A7C8NLC9_ORBOL|nr:hypothetical protein TWF706_011801 [Orbilia oligospora]KAF3111909.1 hypothetical protein TWF102_005670 [Orbilia oligospora]KAF3114592.1 hypothetical protein TWF103_001054 [Orbilia oligospora]KAF3146453.1 hypothetical protein TWF594_003247 [Orbilia oligospora]
MYAVYRYHVDRALWISHLGFFCYSVLAVRGSSSPSCFLLFAVRSARSQRWWGRLRLVKTANRGDEMQMQCGGEEISPDHDLLSYSNGLLSDLGTYKKECRFYIQTLFGYEKEREKRYPAARKADCRRNPVVFHMTTGSRDSSGYQENRRNKFNLFSSHCRTEKNLASLPSPCLPASDINRACSF